MSWRMPIASSGCLSAVPFPRISGGAGSLLGGWTMTAAGPLTHPLVAIFAGTPGSGTGRYLLAQASGDSDDHGEIGTWTWDSGSNVLAFTGVTTSSNGLTGLPQPDSSASAHLTADELGLVVVADGMTFNFTRIVDPATVVPAITSPSTADAVVGEPFSYTITACHVLTFDATGLPAWLSINTTTGVLSGTPPAAGVDSLTLFATNSNAGSTNTPLVITTRDHQASARGGGAGQRDLRGNLLR